MGKKMKAQSDQMWAMKMKGRGGFWIVPHVFWTRSDAIANYDSLRRADNAYRKDRRKGQILAVKVIITEV